MDGLMHFKRSIIDCNLKNFLFFILCGWNTSLSLVCVKMEEETEINSSLTTLVGLAAEDGSHASGKKKKMRTHKKKYASRSQTATVTLEMSENCAEATAQNPQHPPTASGNDESRENMSLHNLTLWNLVMLHFHIWSSSFFFPFLHNRNSVGIKNKKQTGESICDLK